MDDLNNFIQVWRETGDMATVLEKGLSLPAPEKVQVYLASLPPMEAEKIRISLTQAMIALEEYSANLARNLADTKAQMDASARTTKASLIYLSTATSGKK